MAARRMPVTARERREFQHVMTQTEKAMAAELAEMPRSFVDISGQDAFEQASSLWRLGAGQIPACMAIFVRTFA